jgi:glycosyltransferase involved in cell wall biosynthesis
VVEDGVTGFDVDDVAEAVDAVPRAAALDRAVVRRRARERFDVERMVDGYLEVYESVLGRPGRLA